MNKILLFLFIISFLLLSDLKAQTESENQVSDLNNKQIHLTVQNFFEQSEMPELKFHINSVSTKSGEDIFFDSGFIKPLLYLGDGIIGLKLSNDFHPTTFPRTVTDFTRAYENRLFEAEPTLQERRTIRRFWY